MPRTITSWLPARAELLKSAAAHRARLGIARRTVHRIAPAGDSRSHRVAQHGETRAPSMSVRFRVRAEVLEVRGSST